MDKIWQQNAITHSQRRAAFPISTTLSRSARRPGGHILAFAAGLSASEVHAAPGPVAAAAITAQDVDFHRIGLQGASDSIHSQVGDRDAVSGRPSRRAVLIVLLNHDAVVGNSRDSDVGESHVAHGASGFVDGLNTNAIGGIGHGGISDGHVLYSVVIAPANGAD